MNGHPPVHVRLGDYCNCGVKLRDPLDGIGITMQEHLDGIDRARHQREAARVINQLYVIDEEP